VNAMIAWLDFGDGLGYQFITLIFDICVHHGGPEALCHTVCQRYCRLVIYSVYCDV